MCRLSSKQLVADILLIHTAYADEHIVYLKIMICDYELIKIWIIPIKLILNNYKTFNIEYLNDSILRVRAWQNDMHVQP